MNLPDKYQWLNNEPGPAALKIALSFYGLVEGAGTADNPIIMGWAKEVGVSAWYLDDATPWCGLFEGVCDLRAGFPYNSSLLSSLAWAKWGTHIDNDGAMLGDTLIFVRPGGGHVGKYVGESESNFLVLGGNENNSVAIEWISKSRLFAIRRATWKIAQPTNVRKIHLDDSGAVLSTNEA